MDHVLAVQDFHRARRKATLEKILARFSRRSADLLSYDEVKSRLSVIEESRKELKEIPMDAIIGSVGRYSDFTRSFLPQFDEDKDRWARVHAGMTTGPGLPPIEVYQVGDVFFVLDGHHRVSAARQLGAKLIEAYVRQVQTKIQLSPEDQPDDLILKSELSDFLQRTQIDVLRPDSNLLVTKPGQYEVIEQYISHHLQRMRTGEEGEISYEDAILHWYDEVYFPIVEVIRERGILKDFPGRTETDLFLWISDHRAALEKTLEWEIDPSDAAEDLVDEYSDLPTKTASRLGKRLLDIVTPDSLEAGPPPGEWRQEHTLSRREDRLFYDVLAPISGEEPGWIALEQASLVVQKEEGRLRGLLVVPDNKRIESDHSKLVQKEFQQRCHKAGVEGSFAIEAGNIARKICERSRWNDLTVMYLAHPPSEKPLVKLSSGFRTLIRRCPTPILAVKDKPSSLTRALLAYDGSPKAREGLFIASYVASYWKTSLVLITVDEKDNGSESLLHQASSYLESRGTTAQFVHKRGEVTDAILQTASDENIDWIIIGGYGLKPLVEVALGSTVDKVLRETKLPVLICR